MDIDSIINNIEALHFIGKPLEFVVAAREAEDLRSYSDKFDQTYASVQIVFNTFKGRLIKYDPAINSSSYPLEIEHVVAAFVRDKSILGAFVNTFPFAVNLHKVSEYIDAEILEIQEIHYEFLNEYINRRLMNKSIIDIYIHMRGLFNANEKLFHPYIIIGAIGDIFESKYPIKIELYEKLSALENVNSRYFVSPKRVKDLIAEYRSSSNRTLQFNIDTDTIDNIMKYQPSSDIKLYDLKLEMNRNYIRLIKPLNIIDVISDVSLDEDIPLSVSVTSDEQYIIKTHKSLEIEIDDFIKKISELKANTFTLLIRNKFITYDRQKNVFTFNDESSDTRSIMNILWKKNITSLTIPVISNSSYSFVTNMIGGLNKMILAWMIMNPPKEFDIFRQILFIKEDLKSISQRKHITVHIQLGSTKMYLTISTHKSTKGTLTRDNGSIVGFIEEQEYFVVKINRVNNIQYAYIALVIYSMIVDMYMKYCDAVKDEIASMTNVTITDKPFIFPLIERTANKRDLLKIEDRNLFKGVSSIDERFLPQIISKNEASYFINQGYAVLRIPFVATNDPSVRINSDRDIWIRTPEKGSFSVHRVKNRYIPVLFRVKGGQPKLMIDENFNVSIVRNENYSSYILKENSSKLDVGRLAKLPSSLINNLASIIPDTYGGKFIRKGVSNNIVDELNSIKRHQDNNWVNLSYDDLLPFIASCKQECWDQTIDEIRYDINKGCICLNKHWRILEDAFQLNIYVLSESKFKLPRFNHLYLHRMSRTEWSSILFYCSPDNDEYSLIMHENEMFFHENIKFDIIIESSLLIISDETVPIHKTQFNPEITGYTITNQIFDLNGKTRALTYRQNNGPNVFTLDVGIVAPFSFIPEGEIVTPILISKFDIDESRIIFPEKGTIISSWITSEKIARTLYTSALLLYSRYDGSLDDFMKSVVVDTSVKYDISNIRSEIDDIDDYMEMFNPSMYRDGALVLNSESLVEPIYHYLRAIGKKEIPSEFPSLINYTWDIKHSGSERVYFNILSLLLCQEQKKIDKLTRNIISSDYPYIMYRNRRFYNILMSDDSRRASYIFYRWNVVNKPCNILTPIPVSYDAEYQPPEVDVSFNYVDTVSVTKMLKSTFIIIPL